jgi:hypothetical protein
MAAATAAKANFFKINSSSYVKNCESSMLSPDISDIDPQDCGIVAFAQRKSMATTSVEK